MADLFLTFFDQINPKWIKIDQIGYPHQSKNVTVKSCHIYRKDKYGWVFLDQICPNWIKLNQNWNKLDQIGFLTNQKMLV